MSTATKVEERPIIFSAPMVKAILDGRKTQTRRTIKPQYACKTVSWGCISGQGFGFIFTGHDKVVRCPYGKIGDRLWVKETWGAGWDDGCGGYSAIRPSSRTEPDKVFYKADGWDESEGRHCWRSSLFLPRKFSRITLELTDVRVERLHDISAADILAEGVVLRSDEDKFWGKCPISAHDNACYPDLISVWRAGWQKINGNDSWIANPWVFALTFRRVES